MQENQEKLVIKAITGHISFDAWNPKLPRANACAVYAQGKPISQKHPKVQSLIIFSGKDCCPLIFF